jgi:pimeloyl-ACP methyl ester carboxylesterase
MANAAAEARHRLGSPAPPEDAAGYVQVDGLRLRVERRGAGPPLVLINGIGAPIEMWEPFTRRLPDRELILFDLPGSGRSQPPRLPMRMSGYARVVVELMDVLGLGRADVLGYSYGGLVAQELARRSPVRVRKLVLCATFAGVPSVPPDLLVLLLMSTPLRYRSRRMGAVIVPRIAGGRTARDPRALNRDLDHRQASPPSVLGYAHQVYAAVAARAATADTGGPWR